MKVLKRGVDPATKPKTCSCLKCKSRLEYTASERQYMEGDRPGESGSYYLICPVCNERIWAK